MFTAAICGAKNRSGNPCGLPAMPNGKCRLHGGKSTGPVNPQIKHGLYRKYMQPEEQELFDALRSDPEFDDLHAEVAMMRVLIGRCVRSVLDGDEWRVPMQVMPQYVEKLLKLIERMKPQATKVVLEDSLDRELTEFLREEEAVRELEKQRLNDDQ